MAINTSNNKVRIISTTVSGLSTNSKFSDIKSPALVVNTSDGGIFYADGSGGTSLKQLAALPNHSHSDYLPKTGGTMTGALNMNAYFQLGNSKSITVADTDGVYQTALYLSTSNNLVIGYGTSVVGKRKTVLLGNVIEFKSNGNENNTLTLNSDRTATFASSATATKFIGPLQGNADSATYATKIDKYTSSNIFVCQNRPDKGFNIDEIELFGMRDIQPSSEITCTGTFPFDGWGSLMSFNGSNYFVQLATASTSGGLYFRSAYGSGVKLTDKPWVKFLDSSNYTSYCASVGHAHSNYYDASRSRTKNTVLAAPNGADGGATFRALVAADLPTHTHSYLPLSGGSLSGYLSSSDYILGTGLIRVNASGSTSNFGYIKAETYDSNRSVVHIGSNYGGSSSISNSVSYDAIGIYRTCVGIGGTFTYATLKSNYDNSIKLDVSGNVKATKFIGSLQGNADTATSADTATNSNGLAGYTWEAKQNSVDTWVPVFTGNKLQYRAIPTAYNGAPSTLTVGDSNRLAGYNEGYYYRTARGTYDGENDLTKIPTTSGGYILTHEGWPGAAFILQAGGSSSNLGFIIRGGGKNMPEVITTVDSNAANWVNKGTLITSSNYNSYALPLSGGLSTGNWIGLTNSTCAYLSLYNNTILANTGGLLPAYGVAFSKTSNTGHGTHGDVTGDWATYFTMDGGTNRGWIFKYYSGNVASISCNGKFTGTNFITSSDERIKKNIKLLPTDSKSLELKFYEFDYKNMPGHSAGHIAQEVKEVYPELVHGNESETEHLSIDYTGLHSVQIKALLDRIIKLEEEIKILKSSK